MAELPKAPLHALAPIHDGPANVFNKVDELDAEGGIQHAKAVLRIFEIEEEDGASGGAVIPSLVLDGVAEDESAAIDPGAGLIGDPEGAVLIRLQSEVEAEDVARVLVVTDVRLDVGAGRKPGKASHGEPWDRLHEGSGARTEGAIFRLLFPKGVETKGIPAALA